MINKYDDIINLPRHISKTRPPMAIGDRAAQFSPFAALTGHDAAVRETARLTEDRVELDKYMKEELNHKLQVLIEKVKKNPKIKVIYFEPDEKKDGGDYVTTTAIFKKIDEYERLLVMADGRIIPIEEIVSIEGQIFEQNP